MGTEAGRGATRERYLAKLWAWRRLVRRSESRDDAVGSGYGRISGAGPGLEMTGRAAERFTSLPQTKSKEARSEEAVGAGRGERSGRDSDAEGRAAGGTGVVRNRNGSFD